MYKTCVINDPLGQTHSLANSEHCFVLKSGDGRTDGQTNEQNVHKTIITTGRDCGSASWIKSTKRFFRKTWNKM